MSQVIAHQINFEPSVSIQKISPIIPRNKSPQHQKQVLIQKIEVLHYDNDQLQMKQESLQNTIYDVRKLVELTRKEGEETIEHVHSQIVRLQQKKESLKAALKYSKLNGNHLQKCMLFWNEFL